MATKRKGKRADYLKDKGNRIYGDPDSQQNSKHNFLSKTKQNLIGVEPGPPTDSDGTNGDLTVRNLGGGYALFVKDQGRWVTLTMSAAAKLAELSSGGGVIAQSLEQQTGAAINQTLNSYDMSITGDNPITGFGTTYFVMNGEAGAFDSNRMQLGSDTSGLLSFDKAVSVASSVINIDAILDKLAPTKPPNLASVAGVLLFPTVPYYSAKTVATNTTVTPVTSDDDPAYICAPMPSGDDTPNGFYNGASGTLHGSISLDDGVSWIDTADISITPNDASNEQGTILGSNTGDNVAGATPTSFLLVIDDFDPWYGVPGKENFWESLFANVALVALPASYSSIVPLKFRIVHTSVDSTEYASISPAFYYDNFNVTGAIPDVGTFVYANITAKPATTITKCGIVAYSAGTFELQWEAKKTISKHYTTGSIGSCSITGWNDAWTGATNPAYALLTENSNHTLTQTVSLDGPKHSGTATIVADETFTINARATNYQGINWDKSHTVADANGIYVDTYAIGANRRNSGKTQYPAFGTNTTTQYGNVAYNHSTYLTATDFYELFEFGDWIQWPNRQFFSYVQNPTQTGTSGDINYNTNIAASSGTSIGGNYYRWYTKKFTGLLTAASGFNINLNDSENFSGSPHDATMIVYAIVVSGGTEQTYWLDCGTSPGYSPGDINPGNLSTGADGNLCVLDTSSDVDTKVCTFGAVTYTGDLYVRVGIKDNDRRFKSITATAT